MRQIIKTKEPKEWCEYRNTPGATFDGDGGKAARKALRAHLLREQGYLCAYCQWRINAALTTVLGATWRKADLEKWLAKVESRDRNGMYMEYSGILSWYLRNKIRKAQK